MTHSTPRSTPRATQSALGLALSLGVLLGAPASAAPEQDLSAIRVDVLADKRPVEEVLRQLERDHGLNYVVSQQVLEQAGLVNVHLRDVPLEDALHAICAACGLKLQIRGRILILLPQSVEARQPAPVRRPEREEPPSRRPQIEVEPASPSEFSARPRPRTRAAEFARAVGEVTRVDLDKQVLYLDADGLKLEFHAPSAEDTGDPAQAARMRGTLGRLEVGHKVALEYRVVKGRYLIENLVGGTKVRDNQLALLRQKEGTGSRSIPEGSEPDSKQPEPAPARRPPTGVSGPRNPNQAPEGAGAIPDGVLVGNFLSFEADQAKVERGDGEVVTVELPADSEQRAKIVKVLEGLEVGAKVYFIYEGREGKLVLKSTGITPVAPQK